MTLPNSLKLILYFSFDLSLKFIFFPTKFSKKEFSRSGEPQARKLKKIKMPLIAINQNSNSNYK